MGVVLIETRDRVRLISFNRPERHNAMDDAALDQFGVALAAAAADPGADVILLRGEGPSFCSGRDTSLIDSEGAAGESGGTDFEFIRRHQDHRLAQLDCVKPIVAALKGTVAGGGLEIALAADIRVAADDVRLSFPEIRYALTTDTGGSVLTTMLAGPSRAKLMLMTGRRVDAATALGWGLVDEVVPPDDLDEAALTLCREIAGHSNSAVQSSKQLVDQAWRGTVVNGIRAELHAQVAMFSSPEFASLARQRAGEK